MKTHANLFFSLSALLAVATVASAQSTVPLVDNVTMAQDTASRRVTVTYRLQNAPAVVTLDVETNCVVNGETVWASIGGEAISNAKGDVWQKVTDNGTHTITWRPDKSWPDHIVTNNGARAVVTAWALDNTPDYMVVDISAAAQPNTQKYYPGADFLPGGLLGNEDYRKTSLVMRKIMAKDVEWTMGSTGQESDRDSTKEATHKVTLDKDYYIAVFETTQSQWSQVKSDHPNPSTFNNAAYRAMRPVETIAWNEIRANSSSSDNTAGNPPNNPGSASFLGLLRTKTGLDFDLPSEAQWEFAARAGHGSTLWGDGSGVLNSSPDANLTRLGRYRANGGTVNGGSDLPSSACTPDQATAIVGSYAPNAWGLYDMHGNVWEFCLDWYEDNISAHGGAVNVNSSNPAKTLSGATGSQRVFRGGSLKEVAGNCRSAKRASTSPSYAAGAHFGFRVVCTAGLD